MRTIHIVAKWAEWGLKDTSTPRIDHIGRSKEEARHEKAKSTRGEECTVTSARVSENKKTTRKFCRRSPRGRLRNPCPDLVSPPRNFREGKLRQRCSWHIGSRFLDNVQSGDPAFSDANCWDLSTNRSHNGWRLDSNVENMDLGMQK